MNEREKQAEKRKNEILEAALDLFIKKGYAATTIKDIAAACSMSVGLLFHYFDSKESLYGALIELGVWGPQSVADQLDDSDPIAYFESAASMIFEFVQTVPFVGKMFVLMTHAHTLESTPKAIQAKLVGRDFYSSSVPIIEKGQRMGLIKRGDAMSLSVAYWSAIQGVATAVTLDPTVQCPESDWVVDILRVKNTNQTSEEKDNG